MNCYIVKIIVLIVVFLIFYLVYNFLIKKEWIVKIKELSRKKFKNSNSIIALILIALYGIVWNFPYEKFIKFQTIKSNFYYHYPFGRIVKTYEYDDYAYICCVLSDGIALIHYTKKDDTNWIMEKDQHQMDKIIDRFLIMINQIPEKNVTVLEITYFEKTDGTEIKISDSLSSKFSIVDIEDPLYKKYPRLNISGSKAISKITIIKEKIPKNYTINLDGIEYKPFLQNNN